MVCMCPQRHRQALGTWRATKEMPDPIGLWKQECSLPNVSQQLLQLHSLSLGHLQWAALCSPEHARGKDAPGMWPARSFSGTILKSF